MNRMLYWSGKQQKKRGSESKKEERKSNFKKSNLN